MAADGVAEALRFDCVRVWEGVTFPKKTQRTFCPPALGLRRQRQRERAERVDRMLRGACKRPVCTPKRNTMPIDCWSGARCKKQLLKHNIDEIGGCVHSPHEWEPALHQGHMWFQSKEEAECTAPLAFAIAVSASCWAVQTGHAKSQVPRRREHWLEIDPRALREWVTAPLAMSLGLRPPDELEAASAA